MMNIRVEINEKENKGSLQRINETKSWFLKRETRLSKPYQTNQKKEREDSN
jgi:hypothetical protein